MWRNSFSRTFLEQKECAIEKSPPSASPPKDRDDDSYWNIAQNFNELNWIRTGNKGKFPGRIWNYFWSNFTFECRSNYVNKRAEFYKEIWNPDLCLQRISNIARPSITQKVIISFKVLYEIHPHILTKPDNFPAFECNVLRTFIVAVPGIQCTQPVSEILLVPAAMRPMQ